MDIDSYTRSGRVQRQVQALNQVPNIEEATEEDSNIENQEQDNFEHVNGELENIDNL